jgi:hypothetical protein
VKKFDLIRETQDEVPHEKVEAREPDRYHEDCVEACRIYAAEAKVPLDARQRSQRRRRNPIPPVVVLMMLNNLGLILIIPLESSLLKRSVIHHPSVHHLINIHFMIAVGKMMSMVLAFQVKILIMIEERL